MLELKTAKSVILGGLALSIPFRCEIGEEEEEEGVLRSDAMKTW